MEGKRKKFGIEMLPDLHKRLKEVALRRDVNLYEVVEEAVVTFLDGAKPEEIRVPPQYLKVLAEVLASGNPDLIGLIVMPLEYAEKYLRASEGGKAGK